MPRCGGTAAEDGRSKAKRNGVLKFSSRFVAFDNLYLRPMGLRTSFTVLLKVPLRNLTFTDTAKGRPQR